MKKFKLFLSIIIFFIITSCGYQPIYSKNPNRNAELLSISVENIKDRPGQILRNSLINQINPEGKRVISKYRLRVEISENREDLAYRKDMSATRSDLVVAAKYSLTEIKTGKILLKEETRSISSFDVVESVYATLIAEKDARSKSLYVLSDNIFTALVVFFKNK